jgi:hypothetical protein
MKGWRAFFTGCQHVPVLPPTVKHEVRRVRRGSIWIGWVDPPSIEHEHWLVGKTRCSVCCRALTVERLDGNTKWKMTDPVMLPLMHRIRPYLGIGVSIAMGLGAGWFIHDDGRFI